MNVVHTQNAPPRESSPRVLASHMHNKRVTGVSVRGRPKNSREPGRRRRDGTMGRGLGGGGVE